MKGSHDHHRRAPRGPTSRVRDLRVAQPAHRRRRRAPTRCTPPRRSGRPSARAREEAAWWGGLSFDERETHLQTWKGVITRRLAQLADLMHQETGKPHGDAMLEAALAIDHLAWAAAHAEKVLKRRKVPSGLVMANQAATWSTAARRRRRHRAVELPGLHADGLDRLRAGRRQRRRLQAQRVHPRRRRVAGPHVPRVASGGRSSRSSPASARPAPRCAAPASARSRSPARRPPARR